MESQHPEFWNDQERAQKTMREINDLKAMIEPWEAIEADIDENLEMAQLLREEGAGDSEDAAAQIGRAHV